MLSDISQGKQKFVDLNRVNFLVKMASHDNGYHLPLRYFQILLFSVMPEAWGTIIFSNLTQKEYLAVFAAIFVIDFMRIYEIYDLF